MTALRPATEDELHDVLRWAVAGRVPLALHGGDTKQAIGRPAEAMQVLDLSGLTGILAYEPEELVLTARAGTSLAEIEAALAERSQHLAFEPPALTALLGGSGRPTIGGVVAANLSGPRRLAAGAVRDHLLGFAGVNGRGERFKAGGKVVKNVTGYDLPKLIAGSWGTLAALAEITLKVMPAPAACATLAIEEPDAAAACALLTAALTGAHPVTGAAWSAGTALLRLEGSAPAVAAGREALSARVGGRGRWAEREESLALWRDICEVAVFAGDPAAAVWKVSVPPGAGAGVVAAIPSAEAWLDWGGGLVWLRVAGAPDGGAAALRAAIASCGGHATLVRADPAIRAAVPVFEPLSGALAALVGRVKEAFDPLRLLNPGRMYQGV